MPGVALNSLNSFGDLLKHLRRRARLTQRELGLAVGYSEAHMARLESGQRLPDLTVVRSTFIGALSLDRDPPLAARLIELAEAARGAGPVEPAPRDAPLPTNLPAQLTSFIGREREKAEVAELLGKARLLTVTGSGGAGKTRLAIEIGLSIADGGATAAYPDGVWLADLAPVSAGVAVADAIAAALGQSPKNRAAMDVVTDALRDKALLLILDNCEHLVGACAGVAETLLRACPRLRILATSREPLNIPGETTWRIPPLQPDEAVRVFAERAGAAKPGFALTGHNAPAIARICERLDGMPLAIELAAARLPALPVEQIAARLDDRFSLLTGGARTALPRHQTLRTLVDWSYDLLSEPERLLLQRLSVFSSGWTLEAAEAVCCDGALRASSILPLTFDLVSKSLVMVDERVDDTRYRLSETVRDYALGKLRDTGRLDDLRRRHAEVFLALAEQAEPHLLAKAQKMWGSKLSREIGNIRAALAWSADGGNAMLGLCLAGALWQFWLWHSSPREGLRWLEEMAREMPADAPPLAEARALLGAGALALAEGQATPERSEQAEAWLNRAHDLYLSLNDRAGEAMSLCLLSQAAYNRNDAGAQALCEHSLAVARQTGRPLIVAAPLERLASLAGWRADWTRATALYEECLAAERRAENGRGIARALLGLGMVALRQLDFTRAIELSGQGLQTARDAGYHGADIQALMQIGEAARYLGDFGRARACFEEMRANSLALDDEYGAGFALQLLGKVARDEGDLEAAQDLFAGSLARRDRLGGWSIPYSLEGLASVAGARGQAARAARLFGVAEAFREAIGWPLASDNLPEYRRQVAAVRAQLGEDAFAAAWAAGRAMKVEEAESVAVAAAAAAATATTTTTTTTTTSTSTSTSSSSSSSSS